MPDQTIQGEFVAIPVSTLSSEQWKQFQSSTQCVFWAMLVGGWSETCQVEWTNEELAEKTGFSRATVARAIGELCDAKFIWIACKGGRWRKTTYDLNMEYLNANMDVELPENSILELPIGRGIVYFIGNVEVGMVKIGYCSKDVDKRMSTIQTGCPYKLSLLKTIEKTTLGGEAVVQKKFEEYKMIGEWFSLEGDLANYLGVTDNG